MIYTFFIKDLYDTTAIEEPRGWKDLMSELDRPFETHGMFFSYAGGGDKAGTVFKLGFSCEASTLLEDAYQIDGSESFYQFGVNEAANEFVTPTNIFLGDIDFKTRDFDEDYWSAEINQITNLVKLKTRAKLKTNFNKQLTHDGTVVSKLNSQDIALLATKDFAELIVENTGEVLSRQSAAITTTTIMYGQLHYDSVESIEIVKFENATSGWLLEDPEVFWRLAERGAFQFAFDVDYDLDLTEDQGSGTTTYSTILRLIWDKPSITAVGAPRSFDLDIGGTIGASPHDESQTVTLVDHNRYAEFDAGTGFTLELRVMMTTTGAAQFTADWTIRQFKISVVDIYADLGTIAECYNLHDSLNKTLNFITGEYDYLYSELLGDTDRGYLSDGCFSTMRHTNGFRVRQINDDNKAPVASFMDFIDNLNAPGAIGYGIEELESPDLLGQFDVQWTAQDDVEYTILVGDINLSYDIYNGDTIIFLNGGELWGTYIVSEVFFSVDFGFTRIKFLVGDIELNFDILTIFNDVVIKTDSTTSFRDRLRLEKWEHYYGDEELINLGEVESYSEEPFDEILYNEFKLGFRKFADDEDKPTTLEDFETTSDWGLPLTKSSETLSKIMSWIMSTFMINESRGTLFDERPTTSNKLDNDLFLFDTNELVIDTIVSFVHNVSSNDTITVDANTYENYIRDTGLFLVSGATIGGNDQGYLYDSNLTVHILTSDTYRIDVGGATVTTDADDPVTVSGYIWNGTEFIVGQKAEATEKLISSSGLSAADYTYNQRRTMKRFLIRWGRYINSVLGYISDSILTIQNLVYTNNGALTTEIDSYQVSTDCLMGDSSYAPVREDDNITTDKFPAAKFKPNFIYGTKAICDDDYDTILAAHKNRLQSPDDVKNYGYFTVTSPRGETKTGWLMNMKRSPVDRIAKLKLIERA